MPRRINTKEAATKDTVQHQVLEMEGTKEPQEEPRARPDAGVQAQCFGPLQSLLAAGTKFPHLAYPAPEPVCTVGWRRELPAEASLHRGSNLCSWTNMKQGTVALGRTSTRSPRTMGPNPAGLAQEITLRDANPHLNVQLPGQRRDDRSNACSIK